MIKQEVVCVREDEKYPQFLTLIEDLIQNHSNEPKRILVFCETKKGTADLAKQLVADKIKGVRAIHGDKQ